MAADEYINAVQDALDELKKKQEKEIAAAGDTIADAIERGNAVFSFGASHSFMITEEMVYRTGGLMLINPIYPHGMNLQVRPMTMTSQIERVEGYGRILLENSPAEEGDVLLLTSTSGRNGVIIDMALAADDMALETIGITSLQYSQSVESRHSSGKRLFELADLVIDNCAPRGDAAVSFEGFPQKSGPLSTILGCAIANGIVCEAIEKLLERGITPPVFVSANVEGGDEHNERLLAENADRIFYMQ